VKRHTFIKTFLAIAALVAVVPNVLAQNYPNKVIKIITPFPAGQGPDVLLRMVADKMSASLGQSVVVENKPGASGFIAFEAAKRSPADGYTLVQMDSFHMGTHPHLFNRLPYSATKDFDPITPLVRNYFFVVVGANSKYKTMGELVADAKNRPGMVTYGSWGVGSPAHLGGLLLESTAGVKMNHVPFKESSQLYQSVASGDLDWALGSAASAGALLQAGKVKFLAAAAPKRTQGYEKVPTVSEIGGPASWTVSGWFGLLAPKGTPKDVVQRLNEAIVNAMKSPEIRDRLGAFTYENFTMSPADMAKQMETELNNWGPTLQKAGIKLD